MEAKVQPLPFMEWLQNSHPDLYTCCWESIDVSDEGVFINEKGISPEDYKLLLLAVEAYQGIAA